MARAPLPIDAVLDEVCRVVRDQRRCVLTAPPGSGKTTRVPAALVDGGLAGAVVVLQPRRLAARAAARRVASERGVPLGGEVGYQVRHDKKAGADTRIRFVTEGILLRQLLADPFLPGVGAVVLDEFHERSLEGDLAIAMLLEVAETVREDLAIVVMSATLDTAPIRDFLAPCGIVHGSGSLHEVRVEALPGSGPWPKQVRAAVLRALEETAGDVLAFLPGAGEIAACARELQDVAERRGLDVLPLHGSLTPEEQDAAVLAGPRRKVVLSTNVAETSVTIEGVTAVVDLGYARVLRHDTGRGLDVLELTRISRASAEQRRGRAGRTGPGVCYRLWSLAEDRGLLAFELPEIRRLDLTGVVLQVWAFAGRDPSEFGWFEAPDAGALQLAADLLTLLGAVDAGGITALGRAMLGHPLAPRLARMMEEGRRLGCERAAAELAALLSERDIAGRGAAVDVFELRGLLHELEAQRFDRRAAERLGLDARAARAVARARDQIARGARDRGEVDDATVVRTLLAGFPDRVSRRVDALAIDGVMATGRGCRLTMQDHEMLGELFLALEVREGGPRFDNRAAVSLACPLDEELLRAVFPDAVRTEDTVELVWPRGAVVAVRRRRFGELVLDERSGGRPDAEQAAALLAAEVRRDPWRHLGAQEALHSFVARLAWLRRTCPDDGLPEVGDREVGEAAAQLCAGRTRLAELAGAPVLPVLQGSLPAGVLHRVHAEAPERVELPSGSRARIDYGGDAPFVAARLQEFFGLRETPRLAGGRVSLLLHLLAPNQRPVQITSDLASFWANVYPKVRSELRRRYPKHSWPEDPLTAPPEARPRRRR